MLRIGYYPGCSLHTSSKNYDESVRQLFAMLSIELNEIEDWSCCGATSAHFLDEALSLSLPARNLALAEGQGHHTVFAPCAACYNRLLSANNSLANCAPGSVEARRAIEPLTYQGSVAVRNLLDLLMREVGPLRLADLTRVSLPGIKAAPYYGCLLVRSPGVDYFEDRENPTSMDQLLDAVGAQVVSWPSKTDCCGASLALTEEEMAIRRVQPIIDMAKACGANCIVTACPMCQSNLDMLQQKLAKREGHEPTMPVFFLSELVALALGAKLGRRVWRKHFVDPSALVARVSQQEEEPAEAPMHDAETRAATGAIAPQSLMDHGEREEAAKFIGAQDPHTAAWLNELLKRESTLHEAGNAYGEIYSGRQVSLATGAVVAREYTRSRILAETSERDMTLAEIAEALEIPAKSALGHVVALTRRNLLLMDKANGQVPVYRAAVREEVT